MIVDLGQRKYYVSWAYTNNDKSHLVTICNVREVNKDNSLTNFRIGVAIKSDKDIHRKHIGRKISLTRAISNFDRETRKKFWDVYLRTCKIV